MWLWVFTVFLGSAPMLGILFDGIANNEIPSAQEMLGGSTLFFFSLVISASALTALVSREGFTIRDTFDNQFFFALLMLTMVNMGGAAKLARPGDGEGYFEFWNLFAGATLALAIASLITSFIVQLRLTSTRELGA